MLWSPSITGTEPMSNSKLRGVHVKVPIAAKPAPFVVSLARTRIVKVATARRHMIFDGNTRKCVPDHATSVIKR